MANDLYSAYQNLPGMYQSLITAQVVFPFAEAVSHLVTDKRIDWKKVIYSAKLAPLYGACIEGLVASGEFVGEYISSNPLAQGALGPNLWGNLTNAFLFINNTVGERTKYRVKELLKNYIGIFRYDRSEKKGLRGFWENFKEKTISNISLREYIYATIGTVTVWNVIQAVNYAIIPENMRNPFMQANLLWWVPTLTWLTLRGRRKIVDTGILLDDRLDD